MMMILSTYYEIQKEGCFIASLNKKKALNCINFLQLKLYTNVLYI
jgi:hypothetical protein